MHTYQIKALSIVINSTTMLAKFYLYYTHARLGAYRKSASLAQNYYRAKKSTGGGMSVCLPARRWITFYLTDDNELIICVNVD